MDILLACELQPWQTCHNKTIVFWICLHFHLYDMSLVPFLADYKWLRWHTGNYHWFIFWGKVCDWLICLAEIQLLFCGYQCVHDLNMWWWHWRMCVFNNQFEIALRNMIIYQTLQFTVNISHIALYPQLYSIIVFQVLIINNPRLPVINMNS